MKVARDRMMPQYLFQVIKSTAWLPRRKFVMLPVLREVTHDREMSHVLVRFMSPNPTPL